jgi:hypothetical protein
LVERAGAEIKIYWRTKYCMLQKYGKKKKVPHTELVRLKAEAKSANLVMCVRIIFGSRKGGLKPSMQANGINRKLICARTSTANIALRFGKKLAEAGAQSVMALKGVSLKHFSRQSNHSRSGFRRDGNVG